MREAKLTHPPPRQRQNQRSQRQAFEQFGGQVFSHTSPVYRHGRGEPMHRIRGVRDAAIPRPGGPTTVARGFNLWSPTRRATSSPGGRTNRPRQLRLKAHDDPRSPQKGGTHRQQAVAIARRCFLRTLFCNFSSNSNRRSKTDKKCGVGEAKRRDLKRRRIDYPQCRDLNGLPT